jgi:Xaa-Pro aminopeptidase
MVTTIEPGLYFPPGNQRIPAEFRGIGVRIEDDVAVTRGAPEVLTGALVKDAEGIEAFIAAARR